MKEGFVSEIFTSIQGEGPYVGYRQLFIRFSGCSLRCNYCDTKQYWEKSPFVIIQKNKGVRDTMRNPISPDELIGIVQEIYNSEGNLHSACLTGGEPLEQPDFLHEVAQLIKKTGLKTYLETHVTNYKTLAKMNDSIDIVSADVKILHPKFENFLAA